MAQQRKTGLGKGLSALLNDNEDIRREPQSRPEPEERINKSLGSVNPIKIEYIEVNPFQPRAEFDSQALEELAESIRLQGLIQPITVRRMSDSSYQLISGERRLRASKLAGLIEIPAYIRSADDQQMLEMALIENIQRENLNAIEIALRYQRLITECSLKQDELGERVGKNRTTVTNYLRLLKLPPDIQFAVRDNKLSMGQARAIISIENPDQQLYIFKKTLAEDLSVRKVEELVREMSEKPSKESATSQQPAASREIGQLQSSLSSYFGTRVVVKSDGKRGEIKIPFLSVEDLNRILDILKMTNG